MEILVFMFTYFENNTGGDETLLKIVVQGISKNLDVKKINALVMYDQNSEERVGALQQKLRELCQKDVDVLSHHSQSSEHFPCSLQHNIESLVETDKLKIKSMIENSDIIVIAGWGHLQEEKDAEYILGSTKPTAKILICCPPGSCIYETDRKLNRIKEIKKEIDKNEKEVNVCKGLIEKKEGILTEKTPKNPTTFKEKIDELNQRVQKLTKIINEQNEEIEQTNKEKYELKSFAQALLKKRPNSVFVLQPGFFPFRGLPLFTYPDVKEVEEKKYRELWVEHVKLAAPGISQELLDTLSKEYNPGPRGDKNFIVIYCSKDEPSNVADFLRKIENRRECNVFLIGADKKSDTYAHWESILCTNHIEQKNIYVLPRTKGEKATLILIRGLRDAEYCMATGSFSILEALYCKIYNIHYLAPPHIGNLFKDHLKEINDFSATCTGDIENEKLIKNLHNDFTRGRNMVEELAKLITLNNNQQSLLSPIFTESKDRLVNIETTTTFSMFKNTSTDIVDEKNQAKIEEHEEGTSYEETHPPKK